MPAGAASAIVLVPVLMLGSLLLGEHFRYHINVSWCYYPIFAIVYGVWVIPIMLFMFASFKRERRAPAAVPKTRFLCIVPAYNEQTVIGNPIASLLAQQYPAELYEVWVVCNGTDDTARLARQYGASVLVTPKPGIGKHAALKYAFDELLSENDARYVCVFDADNVVSPSFLQRMNEEIAANGYACLQGFHDVLNARTSWVSKALWCATMSSSRLYMTGRMALLRNALTCGTGWACKASLLRRYWDSIKTQTEDIELNAILLLKENVRVAWVPSAVFYDEKPFGIWVAMRQRMRWMTGHVRTCMLYSVPCFLEGIRRRDLALIELAVYYTVPFALLVAILAIPLQLGMLFHVFYVRGPFASEPVALTLAAVAIFADLMYQMIGFAPSKGGSSAFTHGRRVFGYAFLTWAFALVVWPPALVWAFFSLNRRDWLFHTPHFMSLTPGGPASATASATAAIHRNDGVAV